MGQLFGLKKHKTTIRIEVVAGLTTFMTMSYIIALNPIILSGAGMDRGAVTIATCLGAAVACILMGLLANYPFALAPGMGENFFFVMIIPIIASRIPATSSSEPWQVALGLVFISGVVFFVLTLTRIRETVINAIPVSLKCAVGIGIGLMLMFLGMQYSGFIADEAVTFVQMNKLLAPDVFPKVLLAMIGILVTSSLMVKRLKGSILTGIILVTLLHQFVPFFRVEAQTEILKHPSLAPTFMKLKILDCLDWSFLILIFTFLFMDFFDTAGTLVGLSHRAGILDKDGKIPKAGRALLSDAIGTIVGAISGTSTVTCYIESGSGIEAGGRTGLCAIVVGILFLAAIFAAPLVGLVPLVAVAPAIIIVGILMMSSISRINLTDYSEAIPAFITISAIAMTLSISKGIALGFLSYTIIKVLVGKMREVHPIMYGLCVFFLLFFALSPVFR